MKFRKREKKHSTVVSSPSPSSRTITRTSRSYSKSTTTTPNSQRRITQTRTETTSRMVSKSRTVNVSASFQNGLNSRKYDIYLPKAAHLTTDDFKCIFCFKLPNFQKDKDRGIVLCPNCRYPAHADEFKAWSRSSKLCSRCDAPISASYRNKPKIISVKNYIIISRYYINRKK